MIADSSANTTKNDRIAIEGNSGTCGDVCAVAVGDVFVGVVVGDVVGDVETIQRDELISFRLNVPARSK